MIISSPASLTLFAIYRVALTTGFFSPATDYSRLHVLKRHLGIVRTLKFNEDILISGGDRKMICVWSAKVSTFHFPFSLWSGLFNYGNMLIQTKDFDSASLLPHTALAVRTGAYVI